MNYHYAHDFVLATFSIENPTTTPFVLEALLLLFGLPLLFTLTKFVVLEAFGERSHQLFVRNQQQLHATKTMASHTRTMRHNL